MLTPRHLSATLLPMVQGAPANGARNRARAVVARTFDRVAPVYDHPRLQNVVYRPVQELVIAELGARGSRRVLDVGCGTGILAARVARELRPDAVFGCDPSPGMLAEARRRSEDAEWIDGVAESIPLPDGAVDAVVSTTAFHFFDQPAALAEFARVLEPGGVAIVAAAATRTDAAASAMAPLATLTGTGFVPSASKLCEMFRTAGFDVSSQVRPTRVRLRNIDPMVVTTATKSTSTTCLTD